MSHRILRTHACEKFEIFERNVLDTLRILNNLVTIIDNVFPICLKEYINNVAKYFSDYNYKNDENMFAHGEYILYSFILFF